MSHYQWDDEDTGPNTRGEALIELMLTPFTVLRRVLNVIIGPSRMRRVDDLISRQGGSDN